VSLLYCPLWIGLEATVVAMLLEAGLHVTVMTTQLELFVVAL
jgi:hypothetical protein